MQFPIGSQVKLAGSTGDDQIDYYEGETLTVKSYTERAEKFNKYRTITIKEYEVLTDEGIILIVNEHELIFADPTDYLSAEACRVNNI
jgi:hypothetical protein